MQNHEKFAILRAAQKCPPLLRTLVPMLLSCWERETTIRGRVGGFIQVAMQVVGSRCSRLVRVRACLCRDDGRATGDSITVFVPFNGPRDVLDVACKVAHAIAQPRWFRGESFGAPREQFYRVAAARSAH